MKHGDVRNTLKTDLKRRGATRAWLFLLQKFAVGFFFCIFVFLWYLSCRKETRNVGFSEHGSYSMRQMIASQMKVNEV